MQISFGSSRAIGPGAWVVGVNDGGVLSPQAARSDEAAGGALKRALTFSRFKGQPGQTIELLAPAGVNSSRIVLAGLGSLFGSFAGGIILGLAEAMSVVFLGGPYREVVGLILFLIVLVVRPQGLFGARS